MPSTEPDRRPSALVWFAALASLGLPIVGVGAGLYGVFAIYKGIASGWLWLTAGLVFLVADLIIDKKWSRWSVSSEPDLNRRGDQLVGQIVAVVEPIERGCRGSVRAADSVWPAEGADTRRARAHHRLQRHGADGRARLRRLQEFGKLGDAGAQQIVHVDDADRLAALNDEQRGDARCVDQLERRRGEHAWLHCLRGARHDVNGAAANEVLAHVTAQVAVRHDADELALGVDDAEAAEALLRHDDQRRAHRHVVAHDRHALAFVHDVGNVLEAR